LRRRAIGSSNVHYILIIREFVDKLLATIASVGSIWFCVWVIRRKGEFDHKLDFSAKIIRWLAVVVFMGLPVEIPQLLTPAARVILGFIGVAFLAWPNFAYHLAGFLRWCRLLPPARGPVPDGPPGVQG
jgi:hypothetical protein